MHIKTESINIEMHKGCMKNMSREFLAQCDEMSGYLLRSLSMLLNVIEQAILVASNDKDGWLPSFDDKKEVGWSRILYFLYQGGIVMKSMRRLFSVLLAVCMLALSSVAMAATDITDGVVRVEGVSNNGQSFALKRIAAKVDAQRMLAEHVHGVQIDSKTTVENAIVTSDVINASVSGLVKGAREVSCTTDEYGYVHVVLELPVFGGANSLAAAVIPSVPQQSFLPPSDIVPVDTKPSEPVAADSATQAADANQATVGNLYGATGQYTGLIVDCSGLGLQTAMAPAVYTDGKKVVYGLEHFSHDQVINRGYVGYSNSLSSGVQRAGSNPMVVKAQSIEHFFNPVISKDDAAKILAENQVNGFLSTGNVVFVK